VAAQGLADCAARRRELADAVETAAALPAVVARLVASYLP
jgi:hypothetical protein